MEQVSHHQYNLLNLVEKDKTVTTSNANSKPTNATSKPATNSAKSTIKPENQTPKNPPNYEEFKKLKKELKLLKEQDEKNKKEQKEFIAQSKIFILFFFIF